MTSLYGKRGRTGAPVPPRQGQRVAYEVLGIPRDATAAEIREAYKTLVRTLHPDAGGNEVAFAVLSEAYASLKTEESRALYEAALSLRFANCEACEGAGRKYVFKLRKNVVCEACHGTGLK